jgi:hypothetical protein
MSEGTDSIDLESNPDLSEIFEAISKDPLQNKSDLSPESFFLDVDEKIETGASETRKFGRLDINNFLRDLGRNLGVASVVGYQDFAYTERGTATTDPFVEREWRDGWLCNPARALLGQILRPKSMHLNWCSKHHHSDQYPAYLEKWSGCE